ncbi:lysophospholipid acyltransferase family protein [Steroidobacter sp. S1-65]|uniref:Lysophospholipid acyltransferase family protein n=1 Tax=Steroidobacter gossypii TaxID=2805490 RepID=A0ABS1X610_9GAMM|nr:lysophospholipid acyltransferase family protein [Steroidobacter gossypii]MBM0108630.1 lysophospholipid acyltransferase family protein [Steroidobacter gossypii]
MSGETAQPTRPARTKSQRRLTPARMFAYRLAVYLGAFILEVLWRTSRLKLVGLERLEALLKEQGAVVPVFWHQHLLMAARFMCSNRIEGMKPGFMISPSVDGQAPTMLAELYGAHVVRGSGSYTGVRAVRGVYTAIVKEGISPTITPDGPRGPRFKMKPGAIFTAQISGKAVVPIAYAASPARLLSTWDKFVIPWPFARLRIAIGEPYFPPKRMSDEEMVAAQEELERRLHETFKIAERALAE